jgi:hypothetical protein
MECFNCSRRGFGAVATGHCAAVNARQHGHRNAVASGAGKHRKSSPIPAFHAPTPHLARATLHGSGSARAPCAIGRYASESAAERETETMTNDTAETLLTIEDRTSLLGLARLMTMAFDGIDLMPMARQLIARASSDPRDADAMMDLSIILQLHGERDVGLAAQAHALRTKRLYEWPARRGPAALRLLAIMAPGDLMTNTPLSFLVEDSEVALSTLYLVPGEPIPARLPEHDVAFIAISESDATRSLLEQLALSVPTWSKRVINWPDRIAQTSREWAYQRLAGVPGICMPASVRVPRPALRELALGRLAIDAALPDGGFPLIVRPVDSHAGHGLAKVDSPADIGAYLDGNDAAEFHLSRYIDYRDADGLFRKFRIVLIAGVPFAGHMGVSAHWMIHYLNAGMVSCAGKRAEEEHFMRDFEAGFARRHAAALAAIAQRFGLDYLVIDCAQTAAGELLVFELDPGAVVHDMDPVDLFPYKHPQMEKVFGAFRSMLSSASATVQ